MSSPRYVQAIATKYLGPTDRRGSRIKAKANAGSVTVAWSYGLSDQQNHAAAAKALAEKLGWSGAWFQGGFENGDVFVNAGTLSDCREAVFVTVDRHRSSASA